MADYKIQPVISKSGRRTRYVVRNKNEYLCVQDICGAFYHWMTPEDLDEETFSEVKIFRTRWGALRKAEWLDRCLFKQAKSSGLKAWNAVP